MTINLEVSKSENVRRASEIAEQVAIDVRSAEYKVTPYAVLNDIVYVRQYLINLIREQPWRPRVVTSIDGNVLFVKIKPVSRVRALEEALEKALPAIDDEHLYDELMEVLYGHGQK
jgi:hypothetical protein